MARSTVLVIMHVCVRDGFITINTKNRKASSDFSFNISKSLNSYERAFFGQKKLKSTWARIKGRTKHVEGLEQVIYIICKTHRGSVMSWACMASDATAFVFIDDMTEHRRSHLNSDVYRDYVSTRIQWNASKSIWWYFKAQVDRGWKHSVKTSPEFLKIKRWDTLDSLLVSQCLYPGSACTKQLLHVRASRWDLKMIHWYSFEDRKTFSDDCLPANSL